MVTSAAHPTSLVGRVHSTTTTAPKGTRAGTADAADKSVAARLLNRAAAATLVATARVLGGAEARWAGCTPQTTQRIYFANHTSHGDFILVWAALPELVRRRTVPVAAADYWQRGWLRRYLADDVFRAVLIDRNRAAHASSPIAPMLQALDRRDSLIVFPEGTRGCGESLLLFKCGIYHLARERPDIELVPVWIDNAYRAMPKRAVVPAPLLCSVTFGAPTRLMAGEDKAGFLERLRRSLAALGDSCNTMRS